MTHDWRMLRAFNRSTRIFLVVWAVLAFGYFGIQGVLLNQEIVAPRWCTTTSATLTIGMALGWATTAALGGYLIARAGFSSLFFIGISLPLAATILLLSYRRARAKRMVVAPSV